MDIFLLISRPHGGFTPIRVACALSDGPNGLHGTSTEFQRLHELSAALAEAGMPLEETVVPFQTLSRGCATFMPVSAEIAKKIGVLESVPK